MHKSAKIGKKPNVPILLHIQHANNWGNVVREGGFSAKEKMNFLHLFDISQTNKIMYKNPVKKQILKLSTSY